MLLCDARDYILRLLSDSKREIGSLHEEGNQIKNNRGKKMSMDQDIWSQMEQVEQAIVRLKLNDGNQRKIARLKFRLAELYGMFDIPIRGISSELDGIVAEV
jgi:hypothetical protein